MARAGRATPCIMMMALGGLSRSSILGRRIVPQWKRPAAGIARLGWWSRARYSAWGSAEHLHENQRCHMVGGDFEPIYLKTAREGLLDAKVMT